MRGPERPGGGLRRLVRRLERGALRLLVLSLAALALCQYLWGERVQTTFLPDPSLMESWPADGDVAAGRLDVLLVSRPAAPGVALLVNGRRVAEFTAARVSAAVNDGDVLAVDARGFAESLAFCVVGASPRLVRPTPGQRFTARDALVEIAVVRVGP